MTSPRGTIGYILITSQVVAANGKSKKITSSFLFDILIFRTKKVFLFCFVS